MSRWPADRARDELLRTLAPHVGPSVMLAAHSRDWASALFVGARHRFALALEGPDAATRVDRLCAALPEMELDLRGGFVANLQAVATIRGDRPVLGIEALTIEEPETFAISRAGRRVG